MFTLILAIVAAVQDRPDLVLSGEPLPTGAVARFGIPHVPGAGPPVASAAGYSDEGSFRLAVADGKNVRVWTWHAPSAVAPKHLFEGNPDEVTRLALSPDARTLAAGDRGGDIRIWDLASGAELFALAEEPTSGALVVGPRGRLVFRAGHTGFSIWDTATKKRLVQGDDARSFVAGAFSPDGKLLVTAEANGKIHLWEAKTAKHVGELAWKPKPPNELDGLGPQLTADGKLEFQKTAGVTFHADPISPEHDGGVLRLLFTADGKRVVAGGASVIRVWDVESREELWMTSHSFYSGGPSGTFDWRYDEGKLSGMDVSADGKLIATAERSGTVRLKDAATGNDLWASRGIGKGRQRYPVLGVAFHPNGKWLATRAGGDRIDLWDVRTGVPLTTTGGHSWAATGFEFTNGVAFSPDGAYLATLGQDWWLDVFDLKRLRPVGGIAARGTPNGFGFTADGRCIVTGSVYNSPSFTIVEFTPGPRAQLRFVRSGSENRWSGGAICIDPRAPARIVCAGGQLVTEGEDIPTQKRVTYGDGPGTAVRLGESMYYAPFQIALAPDVNRLVSASVYGTQALVHDLKSGKQPVKLEGGGPAYSVAITPDGKLIATSDRINHGGIGPRRLNVWDGETGKLKFKLEFGDESGCPPVFSPDGKLIALGYGGDVVIVGVATQKEVNRVSGHRGATTRVAFSPDGKRLASCGDDGQTLLWDVAALTPKP